MEKERLITTPHDFIWRVKKPEEWWMDSCKEPKSIVFINGYKLGYFYGVNRTFDDDYYYVNFITNDGECEHYTYNGDTEMILEKV